MRRTLAILAIAFVAVGLGACAAGRGPAGEVIVGFDVASLPENATEFGAAAAKLLPSPWGDLLAYGIGGAGLLAGAHYRARKKGEDAGWTDALGTPAQAPVYVGAGSPGGYVAPRVAVAQPGFGVGTGPAQGVAPVATPLGTGGVVPVAGDAGTSVAQG